MRVQVGVLALHAQLEALAVVADPAQFGGPHPP
jgi:hypothetical protein